MQDDAQLAVIGVGLVGMKVSGLSYGQQRQQDKAQAHDYQAEILPRAAPGTELSQKTCQLCDLTVLILHKNALILTENWGTGCRLRWLL
jgi:hypothetical protein